jgi:catechol 2,3-dioxygenase-like lactoylglutathione lyase family enzyme
LEPRITIVTLGVDNLERSLAFYREGLGLPSQGIVGQEFEHGAVAFFELRGVTLALFPRESIAHDADVPRGPTSATEMSIAHNVRSTSEVDALLVRAESAGARIVKPAGPTFWGGYAGYFADPDGHLWEIAFNPNLPIDG